MSMAYLLVSRNSPNVIMLKEKLGDSGLLALFYIWAFYEEYKSSGLKEPITKDSLLRAADSSIDDKLLFDTLVALKLIEDSPEGLTVHGFEPDLKSSCAPKGGSSSSGRAVVRSDQVRSVVDYYRTVNPSRGRAIKPGTQDWQRISARLKDGFTVEELKLAIDGNQLDPWHQKATNGHSSTYIFRNPEKVEGFIQTAKNGVKEDADEPIGHHRGSKEFNDGDQRARF